MTSLAGLLFWTVAATADPTFNVSLDTSSILGTTGQVVFELIDGDGVVDNSVLLSSFAFGGGSVAAPADYQGTTGVNGDLSGSVSMNDSAPLALFTQLLTFGSSLSFQITATNNFSGGGSPDGFSMGLYTPDFSACYSDDQVGCLLLQLDIAGGTLSASSFTLNGASAEGLPAPIVTLVGTLPEPASLLLLIIGIMSLASVRRISRHT